MEAWLEMMLDAFDFELVCGHCGKDLGTFVQGDDFAEEPHACPGCMSRHLVHHAPSHETDWSTWAGRPEDRPTHVRFLLGR